MSNYPHTMIATLGGQPQVVTFALDALRARGYAIEQVILVYLQAKTPALPRLEAELQQYADLTYKKHAIKRGNTPLDDIRNDRDADVVERSVHELIRQLKQDGHTLHLCVSGGRRIISLLTISVAMLHVERHDQLWHIYTPDEWQTEAKGGAIMHLPPDTDFQLINVPMMPWGNYFPELRQLTKSSSKSAHQVSRVWLDEGHDQRCQMVLAQLTPRQHDVLWAFARGLKPDQVAESLHITRATVDSHKTKIFDHCRNAWHWPEKTPFNYGDLRARFAHLVDDRLS